jgi:histidinol phosphatase-like PHP family hydrolase
LLIKLKGDFYMHKGWGGAREGSGRKLIPDEIKKKGCTFQLTDEDIQFIESFEGKNRSESLRNLIKEYKILKKQFEFSSSE